MYMVLLRATYLKLRLRELFSTTVWMYAAIASIVNLQRLHPDMGLHVFPVQRLPGKHYL